MLEELGLALTDEFGEHFLLGETFGLRAKLRILEVDWLLVGEEGLRE